MTELLALPSPSYAMTLSGKEQQQSANQTAFGLLNKLIESIDYLTATLIDISNGIAKERSNNMVPVSPSGFDSSNTLAEKEAELEAKKDAAANANVTDGGSNDDPLWLSGLKALLFAVGMGILSTFTNFAKKIADYISKNWEDILAGLGMIKTIFEAKFKQKFINFFTKVGEFFAPLKDKFAKLLKPLEPVFDFFKSLMRFNEGGILSKLTKLLGKGLKAIPFIGQIYMVLDAVYSGVTGAIEGFDKNGIVGAIEGAITGVVDALFGWIWDLGKDLVSWAAEALGFTDFAKVIDGMPNFKEIFSKLFEMQLDIPIKIFNTVAEIIRNSLIWMIDKIKGGIDMMPIPDALKTYAKNALEGTIPEVKIENPLKTGGSGKSGNITPTSSASKFSNVSSTVQSTAQTSNKSQSSNSTTVISTPTTISNKSSFVLPGLGPAVQGDALSAIYGM